MSETNDSEGDLGHARVRREQRGADQPPRERTDKTHRPEAENPRSSSRRKSRRHPKHRYIESSPRPRDGHVTDQDSDDLLDDYYGGTFLPNPHTGPAGYPPHLRPSAGYGAPPRPPANGQAPIPPPSSDSEPSTVQAYALQRPHGPPRRSHFPPYIPYGDRNSFIKPDRGDDFLTHPPHPTYGEGLWARAACDDGTRALTLTLKLVLTRHGERYKSEGFVYTRGSWDDFTFARRLMHEYSRLKTGQIGVVQKITAYKAITFVYFLQYHAFPHPEHKHGRWQICERKPIASTEDERARAFFRFKLCKKARRISTLFDPHNSRSPRRPRRTYAWVDVLDELIEPGAVIDLEVKETFDSATIYVGLLLVVLGSLGAAVGYGLGSGGDFSTGFSIASWLITAFGFLAAMAAAGEYFGLEHPTMTLWEDRVLSPGDAYFC